MCVLLSSLSRHNLLAEIAISHIANRRRIGFRTVELVRDALPQAAMQLLGSKGIKAAQRAAARVSAILSAESQGQGPQRTPPQPPIMQLAGNSNGKRPWKTSSACCFIALMNTAET